jgi:rhomboid family GlyGly-CTERM serine protease
VPIARRRFTPALPCLIALVGLFATIYDTGAPAWRYERGAIQAGEWWRLLSAHLAHADAMHWTLNMAGLAATVAIYRRTVTSGALALATASLMLWVGLALYLLRPDIEWYLGFSGVLHGLFAFCAARAMFASSRLHALALALLWAKVLYEQLPGASASVAGLPVLADAHLFGAAGGLVFALASVRYGADAPRATLPADHGDSDRSSRH